MYSTSYGGGWVEGSSKKAKSANKGAGGWGVLNQRQERAAFEMNILSRRPKWQGKVDVQVIALGNILEDAASGLPRLTPGTTAGGERRGRRVRIRAT